MAFASAACLVSSAASEAISVCVDACSSWLAASIFFSWRPIQFMRIELAAATAHSTSVEPSISHRPVSFARP